MWLEETTSPSTSSSGDDPRLEAPVGLQPRGVALRAVAEAEVLPHGHVRRAEPLDEHAVDELVARSARRTRRRTGRRRAPATPSPATSSALRSSVVSSSGARGGRDRPTAGAGRTSGRVSAPRMTSRWPRWTPSKVPTATRRGRGSASGRRVTFTRGSLRWASAARRRAVRRSRPGRPRRRAAPRPSPAVGRLARDGLPVARAPARLGVERRPAAGSSARARAAGRAPDRRRRRRTGRPACAAAPRSRRRRGRRSGCGRTSPTSSRSRRPARSPSRQRCSKRYTVTSRSGISTASPRRARS